MNKALAVARWEYIEKVKSKAFLISLLLTPMIMLGMGILPTLLATRPDTSSQTIGIIDPSGEISAPLSAYLDEYYKLPNGNPNYVLRPFSTRSPEELVSAKHEADSLVLDEQLEGYVVMGKTVMSDSAFEYHSQNVGNVKLIERMNHAMRDILVRKKLEARGYDPSVIKDLSSEIDMKTIKLAKSGQEEESAVERVFFTAYGFMMMMFFLIITSGQILVRSMLEEKSNRVVEVLISSCTANQLMAGKVIGLSLLGLTQMGLWAVIGIAISLKMAITLISLPSAGLLFLYFIFGYLFFAAVFIAAGAPVSTEQEAQQINSYLVILLILPVMFAFTIMQNPNSTLAHVLTFIPFLTPTMMAIRIPVQMPSEYEIAGSLVVLILFAFGAIWMAGKIFRTTILLYGKRPSLKELLIIVRAK
ncbi:MAG TPA: ABC transporter permease [Bacteroidota bacterium]|nr:ABC transporter permease [Bacteroidota bacterium]